MFIALSILQVGAPWERNVQRDLNISILPERRSLGETTAINMLLLRSKSRSGLLL